MNNTKLTTVKILTDVYSKFKKLSFDSEMSLQKFVNRSMDRYNNEHEYRQLINEYSELRDSGSQF